jgi:hypothetical protein
MMGPLSNYLDFIGVENYQPEGAVAPISHEEKEAGIMERFVYQIAFYIMAVVLEDYFIS